MPARLPMPHVQAPPLVSLVLPAYNEEDNLDTAVEQAIAPLTEVAGERWEIVLVNDASTDATGAVADRLAAADPRVRVVHHGQNRGLGGAITSGFEAADGDLLVYCDADLPFDMASLADACRLLQASGADLVCGYRRQRQGDSARRRLYTAGYNGLVRLTLGLRVRDVNCPLKVLRREVFEREGLHSAGSFIDAELLARARRNGFRLVEHGVTYIPRRHGVSTLSRPSVIMGILRDLVRYRLGRLGPRARRATPRPRPASPEQVAEAITL